MSRVKVYKIPDFTDAEGCFYSEIEFFVVADSDDTRDTARLACSIQKSLSPRTESPAPSPNRCRRPNGTLRAWFATAAEAVAFAENPTNVAYRGDVAVLCLKPGCEGGWHLSRRSWPDALAAAKAQIN